MVSETKSFGFIITTVSLELQVNELFSDQRNF